MCGLFKIPGFSGRRYFNRLVPTPFFGTRLRRQNFNLAPTQYRQLCRLPKTRLIRGIYYIAKPVFDWFLLGRVFAVRTVSMGTVQDVYFCFGVKRETSKFAITTAKKKCGYRHSASRNYQKKLKRLKFYWDFKDGWRRRTFSERVQYHREHLETFDSETDTGITESQEAIDDFINQQKSANTNKKKASDVTKKPLWNFRINNCLCQIPLKSFFEVLFKLM